MILDTVSASICITGDARDECHVRLALLHQRADCEKLQVDITEV